MSSLELQSAIRAHSAWKEQFEFLIAGVPGRPCDAQMAGDDQRCQLGQWLRGAGLKYSHDPVFADLISAHCKFHVSAARIATHIGKQEFAEANELLGSEFAETSQAIIDQLQLMRRVVKDVAQDHPTGSFSAAADADD